MTDGEYERTENNLARQQQHSELLYRKPSVHHASTKKKPKMKMLGYQVFIRCVTRRGNPHSFPGLPKIQESWNMENVENGTKNPTEKKDILL